MEEAEETRGTVWRKLHSKAFFHLLPEERTSTQLEPQPLELKLNSRQPKQTLAPVPCCRKKWSQSYELHLWTSKKKKKKKKHCPNKASPKPTEYPFFSK
jgi:hypothetical protein